MKNAKPLPPIEALQSTFKLDPASRSYLSRLDNGAHVGSPSKDGYWYIPFLGTKRGRFDSIFRTVNGPYVWDGVQDAWHTWQARAALGKQPTQEALSPPVAYRAMRTGALFDAAHAEQLWPEAHDRVRAALAPLIYASPPAQEAPADAKDAALRALFDVVVHQNQLGTTWHDEVYGDMMRALSLASAALQSQQEGK